MSPGICIGVHAWPATFALGDLCCWRLCRGKRVDLGHHEGAGCKHASWGRPGRVGPRVRCALPAVFRILYKLQLCSHGGLLLHALGLCCQSQV